MKKPLTAAVLLAALAACSSRSDQQILEAARQRVQAKDPAGATIELKNLLQRSPDDPKARSLLGKVLMDSGDLQGAQIELRRALDLGAARDDTLPVLAQAMLQTGQARKLITDFGKEQLTDRPAMAAFQASLAQAHLIERSLPEAKAALARALELDPQAEAVNLVAVRLKAASGDLPEALSQVEALAKQYPSSVKVLMLNADLLLAQGRGKEVPALYQSVLKLEPSHFDARSSLVRDALARQQVAEAQKLVDDMPTSMANAPQGRFLQAQLALFKGDAGKARDLAQPLTKAMPNYLPLLRLLAGAYQQLGQISDAEGLLSQAIKALPGDLSLRRQYAALQLQNRAPARALEAIRPILDSGRPDADTLLLAGKAHVLQGNFQAADEAFAAATKQRPEDPKLQAGLALTALARDAVAPGGPGKAKADAAVGQLRELAAKDSGSNYDLMLINALIKRQEFPAALAAVDKLAAKLPGSPIPGALKGRVLMATKDPKGARDAFEASAKADASYQPALLGLVAIDRSEGKIDDGIKRLEAFIKAQSHTATARLALADLLMAMPGTAERIKTMLAEGVRLEPTEASLRLALVDLALRQGDSKTANQAAQEGATALPQNPDLLERLARTQLLLGDKGQALKSYSQLGTLAPSRAAGYLGLAQIHAGNQDYAAAEREVKRALEAEPASQVGQRMAIQLAVRQGRTEEALTSLRARQKAQPTDAYAYVAEADIEFSRKKFEAGVALLRKAVGLKEPGDAPARLFAVLLALGKPDEAKAFESQWQTGHPQDRMFQAATADILLSRGDFEAALPRYENLLKLNPDNVTLINNVAWLRSRTGKAGAVELAERGLKLEPDNQPLRDTYATVLSEAKNHDKALTLQRQLVAEFPDNPNYKLTLAQILIAAGDKPGARKELEALAKLGDKFPQQRLVTELLKGV